MTARLRKARIEVATLALDAALEDLQEAALDYGRQVQPTTIGIADPMRLHVRADALYRAHLALERARR